MILLRKTLMISAVTLVLGFVVGILCSTRFIRTAGTATRSPVGAASISAASQPLTAPTAPEADSGALDTADDALLLAQGAAILSTLKARDYAALSTYVHPEYGVSFTPYSTVRPESDLCLNADQVAGLASDNTRYLWGTYSGSGAPIRMTGQDYFARFVFNADYTQADVIGVDTVVETGNALENVSESFSGCRFLEYHFPGLEPANEGFDWCSLKVGLSPWENQWRLVALIHSEWTI